MLLQITIERTIEPTEIPLNGSMVLNGIQWYTICSFFVREADGWGPPTCPGGGATFGSVPSSLVSAPRPSSGTSRAGSSPVSAGADGSRRSSVKTSQFG